MICFYHNDPDGKAAAWVIRRFLNHRDAEQRYVRMDYGNPIPWDEICAGEYVYIVDFSFSPEDMQRLLDITSHVFWIDHHKTAIEKYQHFEAFLAEHGRSIGGIRRVGTSGCVLAWEYAVSQQVRAVGDPPKFLQLIGDYDTWAFKIGHSLEFYFGATIYDLLPAPQNGLGGWSFWDSCFDDPRFVDSVIEQGRTVVRYRDQYFKDIADSIGWETEFEGYRCFCMNAMRTGSPAFGNKMKQYKICISCWHDGEGFAVSLYSEKVDVSEIAKKHGGGGHTGASGFTCLKLPFTKASS